MGDKNPKDIKRRKDEKKPVKQKPPEPVATDK